MAQNNENTGSFIWSSDVHYDPFYGQSVNRATNIDDVSSITRLHPLDSYPSSVYPLNADCANAVKPFGTVGCDSPFSLVDNYISAAVKALPNPEFILISGDFSSHRNESKTATRNLHWLRNDPAVEILENQLSDVANLWRIRYPQPVPILPAMGNNDFLPDYSIDVEEEDNVILDVASDAFLNLLLSPDPDPDSDSILHSFRRGGYYANNVIKPEKSDSTQSGLTILVLNTIIYSSKHQPEQTNIPDPFDQFQWLNQSLATAKANNCKIYIMGHIPPTIGSYRHSQFWHDIYVNSYLELVHNYKDVVVAQLFGHLHSDEFRILSVSSSSSNGSSDLPPLLIAPALTPIYGNNPSFREVTFDRTDFTILDYQTRFIDLHADGTIINSLPSWQSLPSFRDTYGVPDVSLASLKKVTSDISLDKDVFDTFRSRLYVNSDINNVHTTCDQSCKIEWQCTLQSSTELSYLECVEWLKAFYSSQNSGPPYVLIISFVSAAIFTFFTVRFIYKRSVKSDESSVNASHDGSNSISELDVYEQRDIPQIS